MKPLEEVRVEAKSALVFGLIQTAYDKKLINKATYDKIHEKYSLESVAKMIQKEEK